MEEQIILLKEFIREAPAPNSEHIKQETRLKSIVEGFRDQIKKLQAANEKLSKELKKEQDTNDWLRDENENLQQQLNEQTNEAEHTGSPKTTHSAEDRADTEESGLQ